jgi:hypothetical protein
MVVCFVPDPFKIDGLNIDKYCILKIEVLTSKNIVACDLRLGRDEKDD